MGHRASYAILRNGRPTLYSSRWGAITLAQALFYGPGHALAYIGALEESDHLYDEVWCEGAVALDVDARRLLWFVGDIRYHAGIRRHLLPLMRQNWPGWDAGWADGGIAEIAGMVGIDPAEVRDASDDGDAFSEPSCKELASLDQVATLITIRRGNVISDYGFDCEVYLTKALALGPKLFNVCEGRPTVRLVEDDELIEGAFIDVDTRQIWVWWSGRKDDRRVGQIARHWPDWMVRRHVEGLSRHVELSGRDPRTVAIDRDEALRRIIDLLAEESDFDSASLLREIEARGQQITYIAPDFLRIDKPRLDPTEKQAILARAVAMWRKS